MLGDKDHPLCGKCFWWAEMESGPVVIGEPRTGVCHGLPPHIENMAAGPGKMASRIHARVLPSNYPSCSLFKDRRPKLDIMS